MENPHLIFNKVFEDNRGIFAPLSLHYEESSHPQLRKKWLQSNISFNPKQYTLRGLHFQTGDKAQAKLIKLITGKIIDFVVDIRPSSPKYKTLYQFNMEPGNELIVPRGFAHGFLTLEPNTTVQYLVDNDYAPEAEGSIYWEEIQELKTQFQPYKQLIIISDKDLLTKNI